MDKLQESKDKLFKQLLAESKDKIDDGVNHWIYLLSVAFEFGYEEGYKKGYQDAVKQDPME